MEMKVYNSLTRRVEPLEPLADNTIRLYTCGPTVYNFAHIGNFRAYTFEDILRRVIQFNGMKIRQVMNLTDVDDKTIRGANAAGVALTDYTKTYKDAFFADLKKLNVQPAEVYPAATDHIPEMIALVEKLVEKGVAYKSEGVGGIGRPRGLGLPVGTRTPRLAHRVLRDVDEIPRRDV